MGVFAWRMYCVEWKTRNAKPARKSRDDNKPATGLNVNPVQSKEMKNYTVMYIPLYKNVAVGN